jgi:hypothetical protein
MNLLLTATPRLAARKVHARADLPLYCRTLLVHA